MRSDSDLERWLMAVVKNTALEEALRRDAKEAPEPPAPSRRRMRALLMNPRRFAGCSQETEGRPRIPTRWLEITFTDEALNSGACYSFQVKALALFPLGGGDGEILRQGEWTLTVTPRPAEPLILEPKRICQVNGVDWTLDRAVLSPLTLQFSLHCLVQERQASWEATDGLEIHMKDGTIVGRRGRSGRSSCGGHTADARLDLPMPLDLERVEFLRVCGQDIYLEE